MDSTRLWLLLLLAVLYPSGLLAEPPDPARLAAEISGDRLRDSVRELSRFEGRQAGTPGGDAAKAYLLDHLPQATLQSFPLKTVQIAPSIELRIQTDRRVLDLRNGTDFLPILNAASTDLRAVPVVFAGYGISDAARGLDEYAGLSVSGKVVLFLRGQPKDYAGRVTHKEKVLMARAHGARAYLIVTGPLLAPYERRRGMSQRPMMLYDTEPEGSLPGLWVTPAVAENLLEPANLSLQSFQEDMDRLITPRSRETGARISVKMEQRTLNVTASNIVGVLPGSDPDLRGETVILGAHYDHFGVQGGLVFPGADDNATGSAIVMEIGRILRTTDSKPKRTILFIAFAAEEQGLMGSQFYVAHPLYPLEATKAMINIDHAGVGTGNITVGLSRLSKESAQAAAEKIGTGDAIELFGFFPGGDHVPFHERGIPTATIVSSGPHQDFHQASDTPEKINIDIVKRIARYAFALLWILANDGS